MSFLDGLILWLGASLVTFILLWLLNNETDELDE